MGRRVKKTVERILYTENRVKLKDTTKFFEASKYTEAFEYANRKRSYMGLAYDENRELVGYYIPS